MSGELNIGDKVRIINDLHGGANKIGDCGVITERNHFPSHPNRTIHVGPWYYRVFVECRLPLHGGKKGYWHPQQHVEKI